MNAVARPRKRLSGKARWRLRPETTCMVVEEVSLAPGPRSGARTRTTLRVARERTPEQALLARRKRRRNAVQAGGFSGRSRWLMNSPG